MNRPFFYPETEKGFFFVVFFFSNLHDLEKTQLESSVRAARAAYALERTTSRRNGRHAPELIAEYPPGAGWKANVRPCRFRFGRHTDL